MDYKIIKLDGKNPIINYNCCLCKHNMALNIHGVLIGSQICHLLCYRNNLKRQSKNYKLIHERLEKEIAELEPYSKEMICESLEIN